jgi:hypothetical protein
MLINKIYDHKTGKKDIIGIKDVNNVDLDLFLLFKIKLQIKKSNN